MALTEQQVAEARAAWPGIELDAGTFAAYVAARGGDQIADLYLACGCAQRDPRAVAAFDRELASCVDRAARKLGGDRSLVDEITQRLRERILVGGGDRPPRITEYTGRGPLRGWLSVIATRDVLDLRRHERHEVALGEQTLDGLESPELDPELQYLKAGYRAAFRAAFRGAFAALEPHERDLIRRHHIDGETVDQLAARHAIHRATAARWVARARERLLITTRARLAEALQLDDRELDSILAVVQSRLDLSLRSQL